MMWALLAWMGGPALADDVDAPVVTEFQFVEGVKGSSTMEVRCPGGARHAETGTDSFRFEGLSEGVCTAVVTGATRARFRPVISGEVYRCVASPRTLFCNAYAEAPPVVAAPAPSLHATVTPAVGSAERGTVTVSLSHPDLALWGLLVCPGGARLKADFDAASASFFDVPDEDCALSLKGGSPARFAGVHPGDTIVCEDFSGVTRCRDKAPPRAKQPSVATSAAAVPKPRPQLAPVKDGQLWVRLTNPALSAAIQVQCPGGYRGRAAFEPAGIAVLEGVPDEPCSLSFKGSSPARYNGVSGGMRLTCTLDGTIAQCEP